MALGANLFNICLTNSENFTRSSTYGINLNKLLRDLKSETPATGFSTGSGGYSPNKVFGLAQCRADVSERDCRACIKEAMRGTRSFCPNTKAAMLWYDSCFLRYSDVEFTSLVDTYNGSILPNLAIATDAFRKRSVSLLSNLSGEASVAPKLFTAGDTNLGSSVKIFGFVDCTRDLSSFSCKLCIDALVNGLQDDANIIGTRVGGRIITASCNIRYETFRFFNRLN